MFFYFDAMKEKSQTFKFQKELVFVKGPAYHSPLLAIHCIEIPGRKCERK
jgi:hypothetical protein